MKKNIKKIVVGALLFPAFAFAASVNSIDSLFAFITITLNAIVPIIFAITFVWFIWSLAHFIQSGTAGDPAKRAVAIDNMIYSIIAMFVMVSVWGLVGILSGSLTLTNATVPTTALPQ